MGITFLLFGCNQPQTNVVSNSIVKTNQYPNGYKFEPPVTVTVIRFYGPQVIFQPGEDIDNNIWSRAYTAYCGIKIKTVLATTDYNEYDTKITTSIATDSLPDIIPSQTSQFERIVNSGKAFDLLAYYRTYLDTNLKDLMEKEMGGTAYKSTYKNGGLLALAIPQTKSPGMQWIRQDWLDKYGLKWPKTINDSISIMEYFCKNNAGSPTAKKTYAFPLTAAINTYFVNAFGAYRGIWIENQKGDLMKSELSPKWKSALYNLQKLYSKKYIEADFSLTNQTDIDTAMTNQQYGFFFGSLTSPDGTLYNSVAMNPNANWKSGLITQPSGEPAKVQNNTKVSSFFCVNKKSNYPEAVFFIANIYGDLANGVGEEFQSYHDFLGTDQIHYNTFWYPIINMSYPYIDTSKIINEALKSKDYSNLTGEMYGALERFKLWEKYKDYSGWRIWAISAHGGSAYTRNKILSQNDIYLDRGWGPDTPTWIAKGPDLNITCTQLFNDIITGKQSVEDGFYEWSNYFNKKGGIQATKEINLWWKTDGKATFSLF